MSIPLSLYIHLPWCERKCPYCDFNSHEAYSRVPETAYLSALYQDLQAELEHIQDREIISIFIGGGTPSLFSANAIAELLTRLSHELVLAHDIEITLEANPGTIDQQKFSSYLDAGINRLSIGVQSFNDKQLKQLGRIHNSSAALAAYHNARKVGFKNINLDLMHGLPGQTITAAMQDLQLAIELLPEHISWYQLTIEPNTPFYKYPPTLPNDDTLWDIYTQGRQLLIHHNYQHYEISAFCQADKTARHNLNYWLFGDYIGIGAGAHGKISQQSTISRRAKTRIPTDYMRNQTTSIHEIDQNDRILEFLMNALRLTDGFSQQLFIERTGLGWHSLNQFLAKAMSRELVIVTPNHVKPSQQGLTYLNELLMLID